MRNPDWEQSIVDKEDIKHMSNAISSNNFMRVKNKLNENGHEVKFVKGKSSNLSLSIIFKYKRCNKCWSEILASTVLTSLSL